MEILNKYKHDIPKNAVFIMRGHPLGNPFVIGQHGTRPEVIYAYRQWLRDKILDNDIPILIALRSLTEESSLTCCCKPQICHGDVVKEYWEEITANGNFDVGLALFCENHKQKATFNPLSDGIDHINIYSKGRTKLGLLLSNFSRTPFVHPGYGKFQSMEGFWYWLGTDKNDIFRTLYGYEAKKEGMKHKKKPTNDFEDRIKIALRLKVEQNPEIKELLMLSTLPFKHYYYYGTIDNCKIIETKSGDWLSKCYEEIRAELKETGCEITTAMLSGPGFVDMPKQWDSGCKLIIAGSRDVVDLNFVRDAYIASGFNAMEIISGAAKGVDTLGEELAFELKIPIIRFPADWEKNKKAAGYIRNVEMSEYGDKLLAIRKNKSKGTTHMIDIMKKANKPTFVVDID